MQCVILAGGLATRLRPLTETIPKTLVPVAGRPFADHQLAWLAGHGVDDVVYAIGFLGERIREHVGDGARFGLRVRYVDEGGRLMGTAGALRLALDAGLLRDDLFVLYGDSFLACDPREVAADYASRRPGALMTVYRNDGRHDRSNAKLQGGSVVRYEKGVADPAAEGMFHIDYGLSLLSRSVVAEIPPGEVLDLAVLYERLAREGRLAGHEVHERFYEIGSPDGLAELEALLARDPGRAQG